MNMVMNPGWQDISYERALACATAPVAALLDKALNGGELGDISPTAELSALGKLMANWQSLIEDNALSFGERVEKKTGQKQMEYGKGVPV